LVAVIHFAGYLRYFHVWVCGFVNCIKYFDKTSLVCKMCSLAIVKKTFKICQWNLFSVKTAQTCILVWE